jgi:hypothetical protein
MLISVNTTPPKHPSDDRNTDGLEAAADKDSRGTISVTRSQQARPKYTPASPSDASPTEGLDSGQHEQVSIQPAATESSDPATGGESIRPVTDEWEEGVI